MKKYIMEGNTPVEAQVGDTPTHILVPIDKTPHAMLRAAGIDYQRLRKAMDSNENWGRMVHAFEYVSAIGVVLGTWPEDDR